MKQKNALNEELAQIVTDVLSTRPEDWGDVDARVLFARVLRLEARIESLEEHHRAVHPRCGELAAQRRLVPVEADSRTQAMPGRLAA